MKTPFLLYPALLATLLLAGCDSPKSIAWYKAHPNELTVRYKECEYSGDDSQDCRNVREARFQLSQENAPVPNFNQ
ncbi:MULTISPECIES: EexN family lipoprotein [unclassified Symbiopectobacterium]|uniref:EexN family lipoprotein n=1 Tax=unclassified Symbiopectobacterium TaxID=2794573 RepID=UPI002227FE5B|nr:MULTISPECIES: EexN family lipoprotein [unclassified Symbiopectobacterium]MCW2474447.1 EexN family lipoprotein [Candidatus Symbiopectobacterium sp. NZEC151]MCW2482037.1 EexN family lipoprotein [Candidatus Symbiopectobacterium sp. NZEC135]